MPRAFGTAGRLEEELASEWLTRVFGPQNYRKMWGPLLKCKLGACREETSAAFIWTYIARYYSTRDKTPSQKERLGYVRGGYRTVFNRLIEEINNLGGKIVTDAPVSRMLAHSGGTGGVEVTTPGRSFQFDQVIATIPSRPFAGHCAAAGSRIPSEADPGEVLGRGLFRPAAETAA